MEQPKATYRPASQSIDTHTGQERTNGKINCSGGDVNLYKISQNTNNGLDTYDSAIVCAASEDEARLINPEIGSTTYYCWCAAAEDVTVELIGTALEDANRGIVLASFNAG